ncbi:MAG: hypothetical protein FJW39_30585 [Acidobacteria bacterium]|nr:hypothetical protein [Acidobacteriota bacterium]
MRFVLLILLCAPLTAGGLLLGRAEVKITPPDGMPMGGGFTIRLGKAAHDDLLCKALVFEQDGARAALVSCDVESLHRAWVVAARKRITAAGWIPGDRVMITATHSHSGPEMTPLVLEGAKGETLKISQAYHDALPTKIAQAVCEAAKSLTPVRVWFARGHEDSISFNRRYLMKDGSVRTNPGQMNPDIVRPAGPIDPELSLVYFDAPDGTPIATIVNFALHTTAWGGPGFSADFPGVLARRLAEAKSPAMTTLFLQGCSGNINQVDVGTREKQSGPAVSERIGTILAAGVLKLYRKMEAVPVPGASLRVRSKAVRLPALQYGPEQLAAARETISRARSGARDGPKFLDLVEAFKIVNVAEVHKNQPIETEVQAILFAGQLAIAGLPAEVFTELGMMVKGASPFPRTLVSELANDMLDYIPNLRAYPEGSYEPTTARCAPGCGEHLATEMTNLLIGAYRESLVR